MSARKLSGAVSREYHLAMVEKHERELAAARVAGAAEARARIVAMMRSLARGIARKDMRSESIGALRALADRIERGET